MDSVVKFSTKRLDLFMESEKPTSTTLTVENICNSKLTFKVKTTQPKRYFVRPNIGFIKPGEKKDIVITHQASKDIIEDIKANQDKFLLQVAKVPAELATLEVHELWKKLKENDILQQKFRVQFVWREQPPEVGTTYDSRASHSSSQQQGEKTDEDIYTSARTLTQEHGSSNDSRPHFQDSTGSEVGFEQPNADKHKPSLAVDGIGNAQDSVPEGSTMASISSPRIIEPNHSVVSLEERYQLALERIHLLSRELAMKEVELAQWKGAGREEIASLMNLTNEISQTAGSNRARSAYQGDLNGIQRHNTRDSVPSLLSSAGNLGFSVVQVFLIVLISFFLERLVND